MTRDEMMSETNLAALTALEERDLRLRIALLDKVAAEAGDDPRLDKDGGVRDQLEALWTALNRKLGRPETARDVVVGLQTLKLRAERPQLGG